MPDTQTKYYRKLHETIQIPAPDDLIQGAYKADTIVIMTQGDYKRGTLLMSSASGFIPATLEGLASADELCVLCDSFTLDDGEAVTSGYFAGTFNPERLILPECDLEDIRPTLRKHNLFLA